MKFTDLHLHPDLQKGIDEAGYITCMPVQEQVLINTFGNEGTAHRDLYVQSQTGTGKTAAFLIVILQRMLTEDTLSKKKALIMAPTRELAVQIEEEAKMLCKYLPFKTGSFYGGVGYVQQEKLLRNNVQILVGTPGRVLDLNKNGKMNLMDTAFLVLDEADRMFDMGFYPDLRKLIKVVPSVDKRQTMLFSATLNAYVKNLAWEYTKKPFEIEIKPEVVTVEEISQVLYHVPSENKMAFLLGILNKEQPESVIVFCNTKKYTEIVAKRLKINGYDCEFIMGDLPQVKRQKIIDNLKAGKIKILVATDVAARGLDVDNLAMVINYDLPVESENYVHRIGRTARAGKTGKAFTLASEQDVYELPGIERYIGKKIPSEIAMEDMYAEDKSAGQRVFTDNFSRGDRGGKGGRGEKGKGRREDIKKPQERKYPQKKRTSTPAPAPKHEKDLSQLSMEERMAVYKKKYNKQRTENRQAASKQQGTGNRQAAGKQRAENKKYGKQQYSSKKNNDYKQKHPNSSSPDYSGVVRSVVKKEPVKKSIFTKLKGLFKKK